MVTVKLANIVFNSIMSGLIASTNILASFCDLAWLSDAILVYDILIYDILIYDILIYDCYLNNLTNSITIRTILCVNVGLLDS